MIASSLRRRHHHRASLMAKSSSSSSSSALFRSTSAAAARLQQYNSFSHQERSYIFRSGDDVTSDDGISSDDDGPLAPTKTGAGDSAPRYPHMIGLPVITRPIFPLMPSTITFKDKATVDALEGLKTPGYVSVFLRKKHPTGVTDGGVIIEKPEVITDPSDIYGVGTFAQIHRINRIDLDETTAEVEDDTLGSESSSSQSEFVEGANSSVSILMMGHRRVDLESVDAIGPPVDVTVSHWDRLEYTANDDSVKALSNEVVSTIREVAQINALFRESLQFYTLRVDASNPYRLSDFVASITKSGTPEELQAVLEEKDAEKRLHKAFMLLNKEREVAKLQQEISSKVEEKMSEAQRKYFLTEQLKSIKKELGMERDDKEALIEKYRKQLAEADVPKDAMETIDGELEKLSTLEKNSAEFNVTRSYLDWLCGIPWGKMKEENFDIRDARRVLDRDHYGLDDVKDTILQFIAVGKLKGTVQGKILCLAGPPGTGKTSIAKSVAAALGRDFYRFSVGGLSDTSEIKGHRRTYIGAMPGKIIQCLKTAGSMNPLVLIDEIDKLGMGIRGDPASSLLEVLDPSQNASFVDHFVDVPIDISKVLFMCTANDLGRIPGPLLDRMEIINLSGYDVPEKIAIAEQYLVPKSMREAGLMVAVEEEEEGSEDNAVTEKQEKKKEKSADNKSEIPIKNYVRAENVPEDLSITTGAIESLVRWYNREAGVRNLAKNIDKITRKLALQLVAHTEGINEELSEKSRRKSEEWTVSEDNLADYVGKPVFTSDRLYDKDPLPEGIVMGLAWTSMGGSALYIETQGIKRGLDADGKPRGGGSLKATGQLGDVMKESTQIAYTVARARLGLLDADNRYFDDTDIHMHVPEGATPKDGPSAGVSMVTSMLSIATDTPVRSDVAMTGEISLTGKVLPVGGIKEKIMAARRAGITCVILPDQNKRDFDEIPDYLKEELEVHFAEDYETVYDVAFAKS